MTAFRRFAFFTTIRDAFFVGLATATMMFAASFAPAIAFQIGATVQLMFALWLLFRARRLDNERIVRTEAWRALEPHERPVGEAGRHSAREDLELVLLRFAKTAAGFAIALYSGSVVFALTDPGEPTRVLVAGSAG
jgi:hypothetical protein